MAIDNYGRQCRRVPLLTILMFVFLAGCGNPNDIVFGPEPLKQLSDQGEQFKKLSKEDRVLLVGYLTNIERRGDSLGLVTGRTVGEVLAEAKAHEAKLEASKNKIKAITNELNASVTVQIINKITSGNFLMLQYSIENESSKTIRQLKGHITFKDATGEEILSLDVDIEEPVSPGQTLITTTDKGWTFFEWQRYGIGRIVKRELSSMKVTFEPKAIAFSDGHVLNTELPVDY